MTKYWIKFTFILCLFYGNCFADGTKINREYKTLVITCASGELGAATARLLARDHNLILTGRNLSTLQQLQKELKADHLCRYEICLLDYSSNSSISSFKSYLNQVDSPPLSGLVLITPRPQFYGKELMQEEGTWLAVFRNTFTGPLEALKVVLPNLIQNGKIVVIVGTTSVQFQPEAGPACVIRRMWTTYTKALSHQLGPQGISINTLSPGVVLTNFHQQKIQKKANENELSYDDQMEKDVANIPLRRHTQPQEVAQTIKFLISDDSNFINGVNLIIDGGFTTSY